MMKLLALATLVSSASAFRVRAKGKKQQQQQQQQGQQEGSPAVVDLPGLGEGSAFHGSLELPPGAALPVEPIDTEKSEKIYMENAPECNASLSSIDSSMCVQWVEHKRTQVIPYHHWWRVQLPAGHVLNQINSAHNNRYEDRNWQFTYSFATPSSFVTNHEAYWTGWNQYDMPQHALCKRGWLLTGIESNFSAHHRDRIFRIKCGRVQPPMQMVGWGNSPETQFNHIWSVYSTNSANGRKSAMAGFSSHHSNSHEDRRFTFHASMYCFNFSR